VHVIGLLVFATVFGGASAFNGDLNQWNVGSVTDMSFSKSIRIVWKNALTCREVSCYCVIWRGPSGGGFGVGGADCAVKDGREMVVWC
jgi:surface protein